MPSVDLPHPPETARLNLDEVQDDRMFPDFMLFDHVDLDEEQPSPSRHDLMFRPSLTGRRIVSVCHRIVMIGDSLRGYSFTMELAPFIEDLRRRLVSEELDTSIRADIRDLLIMRLLDAGETLSYYGKYELSRAIDALRNSASQASAASRRIRLQLALLRYELASRDTGGVTARHMHHDEIIEALTCEMLLDAAKAVP